MPSYCMVCAECGYQEELHASMANAPRGDECYKCPNCEAVRLQRNWFAERPQVSVFEPYVEENFTGKPIEVTTPKQRDSLCEKHGVTYDRWNDSQVKPKPPEFGISDDEARDIIEEARHVKTEEKST